MITAFQRNAFQNNAFQIESAAGSGDWTGWLVLALMQEEKRAKAKRRQATADAVAEEKEITREQIAARLAEIRARLRTVPARTAPIVTDLGPLQQAVRAHNEALELAEFRKLTEAILDADDDWLDAA